jgi:hypothetical protein
MVKAKIRGYMPKNDALVEWLLYTPSKVFFTSVALKRPVAPDITELPLALNITYIICPPISNMSLNQTCNVFGRIARLGFRNAHQPWVPSVTG